MIKVNMINGFFMQISRFLHLLQGISGLLRGSERVKGGSVSVNLNQQLDAHKHWSNAFSVKRSGQFGRPNN